MGRTKGTQDELLASERLMKAITRTERIRALRLQLDSAKSTVKEIKEQIEQEQLHRDQEILDEPEGELGFTDTDTEKRSAAGLRAIREAGGKVTVGKAAAAGRDD
jgi:hypothetical protein